MSGILVPAATPPNATNNQVIFLYKKTFGVVDAQPSGQAFSSEAPGNARPFVFSSQFFNQTIPIPNPGDYSTQPLLYAQANGTIS